MARYTVEERNPWQALPPSDEFVLPGDRSAIGAHNARMSNPDHRLVLDLLPEPRSSVDTEPYSGGASGARQRADGAPG